MKNNMARGEHYDRLLKEFLDKGGDLSLCPFDVPEKLGSDCDHDPDINEFWKDVQDGKIELTGTTPSEEEWAEWEREYQEIMKRKKAR